MSKPYRFGSAISLIAMGSMIAGCAAPEAHVAGASHFGGKADENVGLATRALAALNANDVPTAIGFAERAVAHTPADAGFRALLGNAYFAGGRFRSAEAAFKDSLTIYSNQPQVVLKLALVEIAQGKNSEAVSFLEAARSVLEPADYGLALALAGRPADAIQILQVAARQQGADSRVRQNLALAYALAGEWTEARTVAAQDVPARDLDSRIQQWMQLAKPGRPADQVAALVGVTPAPVDQGQPVQLALVKGETQVAQAAPVSTWVPPVVAPAPAPAQREFVEAAAPPVPAPQPQIAVAPAPPPFKPVPAAPAARTVAEAASPAPLTLAMAAAAAPEAPSAFAAFMPRKAPVAAKPKLVRHAAAPAPRRQLRPGDAVVQLGAYKSPQSVAAAWTHLTQHYPALRAYLPLRARFQSPKGLFWRLSIQGFNNQGEALARCQLLKSRGGNCFVRSVAGDAPVQIASR